MNSSRKGVGGFFEDIPVLIIVTVGISVFLITSMHALSVYLTNDQHMNFRDDVDQFVQNLRTYTHLSDREGGGTFSLDKVKDLSSERLIADFPPAKVGFHYQLSLEVIDRSEEQLNRSFSWATGNIDSKADHVIVRSYLLVREGDLLHASKLSLLAWS